MNKPVPTPTPQQSRSQLLAAAGFKARDRRLTCDECGARYADGAAAQVPGHLAPSPEVTPMSPKMQRAMQIISGHLDAIQREVFAAGAGMKLTFIARDPSNPEADLLLSEDDLSEVAEVLIRSSQREDVRA